jgi:hypothetical protein
LEPKVPERGVSGDQPSVTVADITDPAIAGQNFELIDVDALRLASAVPFRARRVVVRLERAFMVSPRFDVLPSRARELPMVSLQRLAHRPAARQQPARRFGEPAAQRPEPLERDLDLGTGVDEVVVVEAGAVGKGAKAHHGAGPWRSYERQPREHVLGLVAELGCRPLAEMSLKMQKPATGCFSLPYTTASSGSMSRRDVYAGHGTVSSSPTMEFRLPL